MINSTGMLVHYTPVLQGTYFKCSDPVLINSTGMLVHYIHLYCKVLQVQWACSDQQHWYASTLYTPVLQGTSGAVGL